MDAILDIDAASSNSSGVFLDIEPLPPKEHLLPPKTAADINSQMTEIFDALDPEDRRYHHSRLTANLRQNLLANAISALHRNRHTSRAKFTLQRGERTTRPVPRWGREQLQPQSGRHGRLVSTILRNTSQTLGERSDRATQNSPSTSWMKHTS